MKYKLFMKKILFALTGLILSFFTIAVISIYAPNTITAVSISSDSFTGVDFLEVKKDYTDSSTVDSYIYLSDLVAMTNFSEIRNVNKYIVIENATDLYYFSLLCNYEGNSIYGYTINGNASEIQRYFLSQYYLLGNDIDYSDLGGSFNFLPVGNEATGFSGTFDGQGFVIERLFIAAPTIDQFEILYSDVHFLAMFNNLTTSGKITNLGISYLSFLNQNLSYTDGVTGISGLVGTNRGTIDRVYMLDDGLDNNGKSNGIHSAHEGVTASVMVGSNEGVISNSYVAINNSVLDVSTNLVVYENRGTITSVYYDEELYGTSGLQDFEGIVAIGTSAFQDASTSSVLSEEFRNYYYFNNQYISYNLNDTYPVLQGIDCELNGGSVRFILKSATDIVVMSHLIDINTYFSSGEYILSNCIDMASIARDAYSAPNNIFSGTLTSATGVCSHNHVFDGVNTSNYHAILNFSNTIASDSGNYSCYGLFSRVQGTIENIYMINASITAQVTTNTQSVTSAGIIAGRLEGGILNNVHVNGSIGLANGTNNKETYVGGLVGSANSASMIQTSSASGSINGGTLTYTASLNNNGIGGVIGQSNGTTINKVIANVDITGINSSSTSFISYIGGIIGRGTTGNVDALVNKGDLTSPSGFPGTVYLGGIIAIHESATSPVKNTFNNGILTVYVLDSTTMRAYVGGFGTIATGSSGQEYYSLNNGRSSDRNNGGNIILLNTEGVANFASYSNLNSLNSNIKVSSIAYVVASNINVSGAYNYANQTIDLALVPIYGQNFYLDSNSSGNISKSDNSGDLNVITTHTMYANDIDITANSIGVNVNYDQLRNSGNISIKINNTHNTTTSVRRNSTGVTSGLSSSPYRVAYYGGLVDIISQGCRITNSANTGNITYDTSSAIALFLTCISGIAYQNLNINGVSDTSVIIDSEIVGGIDNCVNDGDLYASGNANGGIRMAGIVTWNYGLISSTFNTGNVVCEAAITVTGGNVGFQSGEFEIECGGIAWQLFDRYAQIRDCANYGTIIAYSLSRTSWTNASGIVVRNEKGLNFTDNRNAEAIYFGKIEFTINYGNVYSYNSLIETSAPNHTGSSISNNTSYESNCKAAGILTIGLCSIVNVVNYGGIHSRYLAGGMIGIVRLDTLNLTNANVVYLSNSINYGQIRPLNEAPQYNPESGEVTFSSANATEFTTDRDSRFKVITSSSRYIRFNYMFGGLIAYVYAPNTWVGGSNTSNNLIYWGRAIGTLINVNYSFLINFDSEVDVIGSNTPLAYCNSDGSQPSTVSLISGVTLNNYESSIANMVKYMYYVSDSATDSSMYPFNAINSKQKTMSTDAGGVFHESFVLRSGLDDDGNEISYDIVTNKYILNYFQFIPYTKVNSYLAERIGFDDIALGYPDPDVMGIYALSSAEGIYNGSFIPDNINWGTSEVIGLDYVNSSNDLESAWRGSNDIPTTISSEWSINQKFTYGMKQLNQSIASAVFDLQLVVRDSSGNVIKELANPYIDNDNKVITYYVSNVDNFAYSTMGNTAILSPNQYQSTHHVVDGETVQYFIDSPSVEGAYQYICTFNTRTRTITDRVRYVDEEITIDTSVTTPTSISFYMINYGTTQTGYQVNVTSGYRLSEGASLDTSAASLRIDVPNYVGQCNSSYTDSNGVIASSTLRVCSESYDANVSYTYSEYEVRIVKTDNKELNVTSYNLDGTTTTLNTPTPTLSIPSNNQLNYRNGTLILNYQTINLADKLDLKSYMQVYRRDADGNWVEYSDTFEQFTTYEITGGVIEATYEDAEGDVQSQVFDPVYATFVIPNNSARAYGSMTYTFVATEYMPSGEYQISIEISEIDTYSVTFTKEANNGNYILNMQFEDEVFTNETDNTFISVVPFGYNEINFSGLGMTNITWSDLNNNLPSYISSLVISPYATLNSITLTVGYANNYVDILNNYLGVNYANSSECYVYIIAYSITSESGVTTTTTHYIVEEYLSTSVADVYKDYSNITTDTNNVDLASFPASVRFGREEAPLIRINFDINNIYLSQSLDNLTVNGSTDPGLTYELVGTTGYEVQFTSDIAVGDYQFDFLYHINWTNTSMPEMNGVTYPDGNRVVNFQTVIMTKKYNDNSKLTNITFVSDSPFSGLDTIVYNGSGFSASGVTFSNVSYTNGLFSQTVNGTTGTYNSLLTEDSYMTLLDNPSARMIRSLPNGIYYTTSGITYEPLTYQVGTETYNRYDVIGLVQRTDLTDYTPQFRLPLGAEIVQLDSTGNVVTDDAGNPILSADFSDTTDGLGFIHYRVYSEEQLMGETTTSYTDYFITIRDAEFNVYFDVQINIANSVIYPEDMIYLQLINSKPTTDSNGNETTNYVLSSIASMFYKVDSTTTTSYSHRFTATSYGLYQISLSLADGYSYSFDVTSTSSASSITGINQDLKQFVVSSSITPKRYTIIITIEGSSNEKDWGHNVVIDTEEIFKN